MAPVGSLENPKIDHLAISGAALDMKKRFWKVANGKNLWFKFLQNGILNFLQIFTIAYTSTLYSSTICRFKIWDHVVLEQKMLSSNNFVKKVKGMLWTWLFISKKCRLFQLQCHNLDLDLKISQINHDFDRKPNLWPSHFRSRWSSFATRRLRTRRVWITSLPQTQSIMGYLPNLSSLFFKQLMKSASITSCGRYNEELWMLYTASCVFRVALQLLHAVLDM